MAVAGERVQDQHRVVTGVVQLTPALPRQARGREQLAVLGAEVAEEREATIARRVAVAPGAGRRRAGAQQTHIGLGHGSRRHRVLRGRLPVHASILACAPRDPPQVTGGRGRGEVWAPVCCRRRAGCCRRGAGQEPDAGSEPVWATSGSRAGLWAGLGCRLLLSGCWAGAGCWFSSPCRRHLAPGHTRTRHSRDRNLNVSRFPQSVEAEKLCTGIAISASEPIRMRRR